LNQVLSVTPTITSPLAAEADGAYGASGELAQPDVDALAERSRAGCAASFEALVVHFERRIYGYLYQMTGNQHDAEDLTQVTFLKAFRNIHRYQPNHAFNAWLFTIAKRTALNHFRDRRPAEELGTDLAAESEHPGTVLEREDDRAAIWELARTLKPAQYEALWLRYGEEFSIAQIARVMKTNSLRVRVLLHRARSILAKKLSHNRAGVASTPTDEFISNWRKS
jgi:RNA polymerase sigma-70 factor, ECF subfamily